MSEIPDGIMKAARDVINEKSPSMSRQIFSGLYATVLKQAIEAVARSIFAERNRCLSIIQSIETTSAQGMRVIDEIVRKVRGQA